MRKYMIGTGYYESSQRDSDFYKKYWLPNTLKYSSPEKIIIVSAASPNLKKLDIEQWIDLTINPGHTDHMRRTGDMSLLGGWTIGFILGAMYAYSCGCDFIYKEQDCLAFGNWVEEARRELSAKNVKMLMGRIPEYQQAEGTEVCLVYIERDFIPEFISRLMGINKSDRDYFCEYKFLEIMRSTSAIGYFDFGYGGARPFNDSDSVFFIQKPRWWYIERRENPVGHSGVPDSEIEELIKKGLLDA